MVLGQFCRLLLCRLSPFLQERLSNMIKIRIRNADHEIAVQFLISENEQYTKLAEIHAIEDRDDPQSASASFLNTSSSSDMVCTST